MEGARFYGKHDIRIDRLDVPECSADEVIIRPAYVGICGSDVHEYERGATLMPTTPHPLTGNKIPITMGHEVSGMIEKIGSGVDHLTVGQEVAIQPLVPDGKCVACRGGHVNRCQRSGFYGMSLHLSLTLQSPNLLCLYQVTDLDGGLARFMRVKAANIKPLPQGVTLKEAALTEPLSVGWHAVRRSGIRKDQATLIIGAGPIGLALLLALKAREAKPIVVSDMSPSRLQAAKDLGADHAIDASKNDVVKTCLEITQEDGVAVAFDAAGVQATLDQAVAAVEPGGTIMNIAIWGGPSSIMPNGFTMGEKTYTGSGLYTPQDFDEVINAIASGKIRPERMITKVVKLTDVVEEGIHSLQTNIDEQIKILVAPQE